MSHFKIGSFELDSKVSQINKNKFLINLQKVYSTITQYCYQYSNLNSKTSIHKSIQSYLQPSINKINIFKQSDSLFILPFVKNVKIYLEYYDNQKTRNNKYIVERYTNFDILNYDQSFLKFNKRIKLKKLCLHDCILIKSFNTIKSVKIKGIIYSAKMKEQHPTFNLSSRIKLKEWFIHNDITGNLKYVEELIRKFKDPEDTINWLRYEFNNEVIVQEICNKLERKIKNYI